MYGSPRPIWEPHAPVPFLQMRLLTLPLVSDIHFAMAVTLIGCLVRQTDLGTLQHSLHSGMDPVRMIIGNQAKSRLCHDSAIPIPS